MLIVNIRKGIGRKMKIYELIKELCEFDADCEVEIRCELDKVDVDIEDENGDEKTISVDFEDTCDVDVMSERVGYGSTRKEKCILRASF